MKKQQPQNWKPVEVKIEGEVFKGEYCIEAGSLIVRYGERRLPTHSIGPDDKAMIARQMLRELVEASKESDNL